MDRVDLSELTVEDFTPLLGEAFSVAVYPDGPVLGEVTLLDATPNRKWADDQREPFKLTFEGPAAMPLDQRMFTMEHSGLGKLDIFIVPVRGDTETRGYEAIFS